ncbi:hypothetical protein [Vannielia litorea]|uniref:hypothetical protein n=1 Tax=Vannielia litorea TaxID=1217970 RepID=UPI001BCDA2C1|nr:hypothetical protein [Vannielia litorea]MBS8226138.1 hypothetical protein [Vannielia litorea]
MSLATQAAALLQNRASALLHFNLHGLAVNPVALRALARDIAGGKITVVHDRKSTAAHYDSVKNEISVPFKSVTHAQQGAALLHEAIHALADKKRIAMIIGKGEQIAYIAQCLWIYYIYKAQIDAKTGYFNPYRSKVLSTAYDVSRPLQNTRAGTLKPAQLAPLEAALRATPRYKTAYDKMDFVNGL